MLKSDASGYSCRSAAQLPFWVGFSRTLGSPDPGGFAWRPQGAAGVVLRPQLKMTNNQEIIFEKNMTVNEKNAEILFKNIKRAASPAWPSGPSG